MTRLRVGTLTGIAFAALVLACPPQITAQPIGRADGALSAGPLLALSVEAQVIASDRPATSELLAQWAEDRGGYFVFRSLDRVVLRVPPASLPELRDAIAGIGDDLVVYHPAAVDLRSELRDVDAAIAARTETLTRILEYLEDAGVSATLEFERELRSLNDELERYAGRKRAILNDAAFARVTIGLSAGERTVPSQQWSSFAWINTIDLYRFIDEMHGGAP